MAMERLRQRWGVLAASVDAGLAALLAGAGAWDWWYSHDPAWRLPLQLLVAATVAGRRRAPLLAFGTAVGAALLLQASPGAEGNAAIVADAYAVGRHATARWRSLALLLLVAALLAATPGGLARSGPMLVVVVIAWLAGDLVRDRAAAGAAAAAEREAAGRGAAEERQRIARELHDVIAHGVAVMVVQAEAARNLLGRDPGRAAQAMDTVSAAGREALAELRQLLELLGPGDEEERRRPVPGVDDIDALVDRVRAAGQPVALRLEGEPLRLPAAVGLAAFRVVQEGLTNAVRHAPGAATEVHVVFGPELLLEVLDTGGVRAGPAARGARRGLAGLRERVALLGGRLSAGPTAAGGYALRAAIPVEPVP